MKQDEQIGVMRACIKKYGAERQTEVAVEEASELIKAICKCNREHNRQALENLYEEMADMQIMLFQLEMIYGGNISDWMDKKLERQKERMRREDD